MESEDNVPWTLNLNITLASCSGQFTARNPLHRRLGGTQLVSICLCCSLTTSEPTNFQISMNLHMHITPLTVTPLSWKNTKLDKKFDVMMSPQEDVWKLGNCQPASVMSTLTYVQMKFPPASKLSCTIRPEGQSACACVCHNQCTVWVWALKPRMTRYGKWSCSDGKRHSQSTGCCVSLPPSTSYFLHSFQGFRAGAHTVHAKWWNLCNMLTCSSVSYVAEHLQKCTKCS
jgi:hypothetical protein